MSIIKSSFKQSRNKYIIVILLIIIVTLWGFNRSLQQSNLRLREDISRRMYFTMIELHSHSFGMGHQLGKYNSDNLTDETIEMWRSEIRFKRAVSDSHNLPGVPYYYATMNYAFAQYIESEHKDKDKLLSILRMANKDLNGLIDMVLSAASPDTLYNEMTSASGKEFRNQINEYVENSKDQYLNR